MGVHVRDLQNHIKALESNNSKKERKMTVSQKLASQVRKVSQLNNVLGVSNVKNLNPATLQNCPQSYQLVQTIVNNDEKIIAGKSQNFEKKTEIEEVRSKIDFPPLPAKRLEQPRNPSCYDSVISILEQ